MNRNTVSTSLAEAAQESDSSKAKGYCQAPVLNACSRLGSLAALSNWPSVVDLGAAGAPFLEEASLAQRFSTTVPCMAYWCAANSLQVRNSLQGGGSFFSRAIGACELPAGSAVCLINYPKLMMYFDSVSALSDMEKVENCGCTI